MSTVKKMTESELQTLRDLQVQYSDITAKFGQIKVERILAENQLERMNQLEQDLTDQYKAAQRSEEEFLKSLQTTYGNVTVNIETGEVTENK